MLRSLLLLLAGLWVLLPAVSAEELDFAFYHAGPQLFTREEAAKIPQGGKADVSAIFKARGFDMPEGSSAHFDAGAGLVFFRSNRRDLNHLERLTEELAAAGTNADIGVKQVKITASCYTIPVAALPPDFSADTTLRSLPHDKLVLVDRSTILCRGGQRSKSESRREPAAKPDAAPAAAGEHPGDAERVFEIEVTVGEDGTTIDANMAWDIRSPRLAAGGKDGTFSVTAQILTSHRGAVLQELGITVEEENPRLVLLLLEFQLVDPRGTLATKNPGQKMKRFAFLLLVVSVRASEPEREVFPVPPVIASSFLDGGLAAFNPFDPGDGSGAAPAPAASDPGADASRLPAGPCYDILRVWQAAGFVPRGETGAFYHPGSGMIFARFAPEDREKVRAFCDWPAAMWMNETDWSHGNGAFQGKFRATAWLVPAAGAGGSQFQPRTVTEFMALPAAARRLYGRLAVVVRGGQRSAAGLWRPDAGPVPPGMAAELECTMSEDGSTIETGGRVSLTETGPDNSPGQLEASISRVLPFGEDWLMEAGTLPGTPVRRVFLVIGTEPVSGRRWKAEELRHAEQRWTGRDRSDVALPAGRVFRFDLPDNSPEPPAGAGPAWFEGVPVREVTDVLTKELGLTAGGFTAWQTAGLKWQPGRFYVRGSTEAMARMADAEAAVSRERGSLTCDADAVIFRRGPGTLETLWRFTNAGSGTTGITVGSPEDGAVPSLKLELNCSRPSRGFDDSPDADQRWRLAVSADIAAEWSLSAPVNLPRTEVTGDAAGASWEKSLGRDVAGREIVLSVQLRSRIVSSPVMRGSPLVDWWWRHQLAESGGR